MLSPNEMAAAGSPNTEQLYQARLHRYVTAMNNEQPDRIPIRLFAEEFAAKYAGYSNFEPALDYDLAFAVTRKCAAELGVDATMSNAIVNWWGMAQAIGWKGITFPGIGMTMKSATQWTEPDNEEEALLKAGEYEEFTDDPTAFLVRTWLARFSRHLQAVGQPVTYEHNMALINGGISFWQYMLAFGKYAGLLRSEAGVVSAVAGTLKAPLDILGDKLRGYVNLVYDLHERREQVIAACEALMPHLLTAALAGADPDHQVPVTIWMHRGCVPFVSPRDFDEIYWATLKPIVEEIWARGHQVLFYAEGNWDYHLERFAELPEKSIVYHVDRGDIFKVKKALGHKFCLSGGIPNNLLSTGTPDLVRAQCQKIIEGVAQDGGYIMDASALIMDDAKVENVKAMVDYTLEHGGYSRPARALSGRARSSAVPGRSTLKASQRGPGVTLPWNELSNKLPPIEGDPNLVRRTWESVDALGYSVLWTNLTW